MMAEKPSDIHSIRERGRELVRFERFRAALPLLRPFLRIAGVETSKIEDALKDLAGYKKEFEDLVQAMDRFNELFAARGWVAYDYLNLHVAKAAIAAAATGDPDHAEELLVEHYTADQVAMELRTLTGLSCFRPRLRLAELALTDYREGRHHACVPVVLALLDGMVNDLSNQGFFSKNVDLSAWDSIAACSNGLSELKALLFRMRQNTTEEPITVPYRNGIHHGMDLGYDNRLVAAKSWAALFATADWACRIEQGKKEAPPKEAKPTWRDVLKLFKHNNEEKARLEAWRPRRPDDPSDPSNADSASPEAAIAEFLNAWRAKKYGIMARRTHPFSGDRTLNALAGEVRDYYKEIRLDDFEVEGSLDTAPCATEIRVRGRGVQYGTPFEGSRTFRLVRFDEKQNPAINGASCGTWFVMTWNPWQQPSDVGTA